MRTLHLASLALVASSACATVVVPATPATSTAIPAGPNVAALVRDSAGRELGTLTVVETANGLTTVGTLRGLPPGAHGIHIHMVGQCDGPAFASAGAHWNPTSRMHGFDNPQGPHMGDMRNIMVGADSIATVNTTTPGGTLRGTTGVLDTDGASVVVHAAADDYATDPSGNSGARIACGVLMP